MSSGLYAALSASIARMQGLEVTTNNLANANTPGYKRDRQEFESLFRDATQDLTGKGTNFVRIRKNVTDFSQAETVFTDDPLDLAIDGEGFFKLQGEGRFLFTRRGNFQRSPDGYLVSSSGLKVVDEGNQPIAVPDLQALRIDEQGNISGGEGEAGVLPLFTVDDLQGLIKEGDGNFSAAPGVQVTRMGQPRILQKRLETSNVHPLQEMSRMIEGLRAFEAYQKVLKTYGNLASKADELGSVG